jgi:nucleoid DNA-binding protein
MGVIKFTPIFYFILMAISESLREERDRIIKQARVPKYTQKRLKELRALEQTLVKKSVGERKYISNGRALTTSQIQRLVSLKTGFQLKDVKEILESHTEIILEEIYNRRPVDLAGLGSFYSTYRSIRPTRSPLDNSQTWLSQPVSQLTFFIKRPLALKMREFILTEEEIMANYHPIGYVKESRERVEKEIDLETKTKIEKAKKRNEEVFGNK